MNKKSVISVILALVLCLQLVLTAAGAMMGDADKDGKLSASDARAALRASVNLETLDEEGFKAADVDFDGKLSASDARSILRASVNLEKLPEPQVHPEYHDFRTISVTGKTKCSFPGCEAELPSFNDIVNPLKTATNGVNYFTCVTEDIAHNDAPVLGGSMADDMGEEEMEASTEITYNLLGVNRLITNNNFYTKHTGFVSALTDKDVKSIKIEKADGIDFVSALPEKIKSGKVEYDISSVKSYQFPEVYKITLVIPSEKIDITKPVSGSTVFEKIYSSDYNNMLEDLRSEVSSGFDELSKEMEGLEFMFRVKAAGSITSLLTVEYFVTADTFTPVAAKYAHGFDVVFDIKMTNAIDVAFVTPMITMLQKMNMTTNSYFFFNNGFGIQ